MAAVTFAVPGGLDQPTGGYAYDRRVIAGLRERGCEVDVIDLGDGFPRPTPDTVLASLPRLMRVPADRPIVVDGLALGVLPEAAAALRSSHRVIALVHHPLALESGLTLGEAATLRQRRRGALSGGESRDSYQPGDAPHPGGGLRCSGGNHRGCLAGY